MKKIFILTLSLFSSSLVFATPTTVMCPATLTCNYDAGTCEMPAGNWTIDADRANMEFQGTKQINLDYISATKLIGNPGYTLTCAYKWETDHGGMNYPSFIDIDTTVNALGGKDWELYGFGKRYASCTYNDGMPIPASCYGLN